MCASVVVCCFVSGLIIGCWFKIIMDDILL
jgi:hypothetical protein